MTSKQLPTENYFDDDYWPWERWVWGPHKVDKPSKCPTHKLPMTVPFDQCGVNMRMCPRCAKGYVFAYQLREIREMPD